MAAESVSLEAAEFEGYFGTPRFGLLDLLGDTLPHRTLEIGCGSGANLAELRHRAPDCSTTGVELDSRAAAAASQRQGVDRIICGDVLDQTRVRFDPGSFDLIILSHVLEHFADPSAVVDRALAWLEPTGSLLVALPNVRHASVLIELLLRRDFRYRAAGILDRTHLRFYTRKSALRWFDEIGLHPVRSAPDVDGAKSRLLLWCSLGLARDLSAYAYNFLLCRK